jgi:hypothetical protein
VEAADKVPQALPVQPAPASDQVTPWLLLSFVTVAMKACVALVPTVAVAGDKVTTIPGSAATTVIVAPLDFAALETEVAVRVTVAGVGRLAGAVYVICAPDALKLADSVPHAAPLQPAPDSAQVNPLF